MTKPRAPAKPTTGIDEQRPRATDDRVIRDRQTCLEDFGDAWNARDVEGLMKCMAEDCAFLSAAGPDASGAVYNGREAVRAAYAAIFDAFPEAAWTNPRHVVAGDRGFSEWRFVGVDRQGTRVAVDGCDLFTFDGALIRIKNSFRKQTR